MDDTFEVNGSTYRVKPIQPWIQPYLSMYSALARKQPETVEEAERVSKGIEDVIGKLLGLVSPCPPEEDVFPVFLALMNHIQRLGEKSTEFFRQRVVEGGGAAGVKTVSAAVGSSRAESGRVFGS